MMLNALKCSHLTSVGLKGLRLELGDSGKNQLDQMYFSFDLIHRCSLLPGTSLIGHSFNTAFPNCESVECIILRFINTLYLELTLIRM